MMNIKKIFFIEETENKHTFIDKLCTCEKGNTILCGYEQKKFYILRYASSRDYISSCFGLGIMCQSKLDYIKNIIYNKNENSLIIFFDNILVKYTLNNGQLIKKYSIKTTSYIFDVKQFKEKIVIIHEIGVTIINYENGMIIDNYHTDIIVNYEFKQNFLELSDMSKITLNIKI